jgi:hypothetical protein
VVLAQLRELARNFRIDELAELLRKMNDG